MEYQRNLDDGWRSATKEEKENILLWSKYCNSVKTRTNITIVVVFSLLFLAPFLYFGIRSIQNGEQTGRIFIGLFIIFFVVLMALLVASLLLERMPIRKIRDDKFVVRPVKVVNKACNNGSWSWHVIIQKELVIVVEGCKNNNSKIDVEVSVDDAIYKHTIEHQDGYLVAFDNGNSNLNANSNTNANANANKSDSKADRFIYFPNGGF